MLPVFYQTHLEKYLSQAQMITLKLLVWLLQNQKQVKIERLAATLPLPIQQNSRRRHIQRFLNLTKLSVVILWFPLIKEIVSSRIASGKQLIIALDRTQWQENNILMVSAIYQKRALPIFWIVLAKKGASNLREQQNILRPVIKLFRTHKIVIIGDREFHSVEQGAMDTPTRSEVCVEAKERHKLSTKKTKVDPFVKSEYSSRTTAICGRN
jgi:hypothetical protein